MGLVPAQIAPALVKECDTKGVRRIYFDTAGNILRNSLNFSQRVLHAGNMEITVDIVSPCEGVDILVKFIRIGHLQICSCCEVAVTRANVGVLLPFQQSRLAILSKKKGLQSGVCQIRTMLA